MRVIHKTMACSLLFVAGILLAGCGLREDRVLELLSEKYGESFVIEEDRGNGTYIVCPEGDPSLLFRADADRKAVSDNYACKSLCRRLSEQMSGSLAGLSGDVFVYTECMVDVTALDDPDISLDEYLEISPGNRFVVYLFTDGSLPEEWTDYLSDGLEEMSGQVQVYVTDGLGVEQVKRYLADHDTMYDEFWSAYEGSEAGIFRFENGVMEVK